VDREQVPQAAWDRVGFVKPDLGGVERCGVRFLERGDATLEGQCIRGDDRLRRGRFVWMVASRGPGRPRKTPGKTISADSHEYALAV
jgi:hypothetical protein